MQALGVLWIRVRVVIARMVVTMLGGGRNRMLSGVQVTHQVQHRPHKRTQGQQHKEADPEQIDGGRCTEHCR